MAETITYGSYTFPYPTPLVGYGVEPIYIQGAVDHTKNTIEIVGNLTGANLSGLHLQKMQMISGMLSEFQTLNITNDDLTLKAFSTAKPISISFDSSDLTTIMPYSVSFESYSEESFSEFFGIEDPQDKWTFQEQEGRITEVNHSVSARGVKVNGDDPLVNARNFVTGRTTGCRDLSLFQTGANNNAFLFSRTENIDKSNNLYSIDEIYNYSTSEDLTTTGVSKSGILNSSTKISFSKEDGLNVVVNGSVKGDFEKPQFGTGLLDTGIFDSNQAAQLAVNAVASSLSDYETGAYTFINNGPSSVNYDLDTGSNVVNFTYNFTDPENLDRSGNVLHTRSATVSASKDESIVRVSINGEFKYKGPFDIVGTGDPATGERFKQVDSQYSGVLANSGFLNLAIEALQDFTGDATGYHISGDFLNPIPTSRQITKNPLQSLISYSLEFDNRIDLSSGLLSGLQISITDKRPIELSGIVPSLGGFAKQKLINRRAGEYSVSASCEASTGDLQKLIEVSSGYASGVFSFAESSSLNDQTISYNMSRYY